MQGKYRLYEFQVGGRTLMLRSQDGRHVLKRVLEGGEPRFYLYVASLHISHPSYQITHFIPKFTNSF